MSRNAYVITRTRGGEDQDLVASGTGHWVTRTLEGRVSPHATVFLNLAFAEDAVVVAGRHHADGLRLTRVDPHNFPIGSVHPAGADDDDPRRLALDAAHFLEQEAADHAAAGNDEEALTATRWAAAVRTIALSESDQ